MKTHNIVIIVVLAVCAITLIGCMSSQENELVGEAIGANTPIVDGLGPSDTATTWVLPTFTATPIGTPANVSSGTNVATVIATDEPNDEPDNINLHNSISLIAQNESAYETNLESTLNLDVYGSNLHGNGSDIQLFERGNNVINYYLKPINGALAYIYEGIPPDFRACRQNMVLFRTDEIAVISTDVYLCVITSLGYLSVVKIERLHPLGLGSIQLRFEASGTSPIPQETRTFLTVNTPTP